MQSSSILSVSPSFGRYSSNSRLSEIAARVVEECRAESALFEVDDVFGSVTDEAPVVDSHHEEAEFGGAVKKDGEDEIDDFDFSFVCERPELSPISADEIFCNGQIKPMFPIFDGDLLLGQAESEIPAPLPIRLPLRKLMAEDRDPPSFSSSEADDLDGIPPGTYCAWTPRPATEDSPNRCKKSASTGSSKRWKFRDLLRRSSSDGQDAFIFLTPSGAKKRDGNSKKATAEAPKVVARPKPKVVAGGDVAPVPAVNDAHYVKNRALKEGDRRRSYLPYKQDLVGLLANVNGLSRNLHPF